MPAHSSSSFFCFPVAQALRDPINHTFSLSLSHTHAEGKRHFGGLALSSLPDQWHLLSYPSTPRRTAEQIALLLSIKAAAGPDACISFLNGGKEEINLSLGGRGRILI